MGKKTKKDFSEAVCHKNDELTLEIIDMGTEGEGIAVSYTHLKDWG